MNNQKKFGSSSKAFWVPRKHHIERSKLAAFMRHNGFDTLEAFHQATIEKPDWFWAAAAEDLGVELKGTRSSVQSVVRGKPFPQWFEGQSFNAVRTCLDRHVADPVQADRLAVVYEADSGYRRSLTYKQLHDEAHRFAAALLALGVTRGDRVTLFIPPVPEAAAVFLGCARIGAIAVPAFSGYGSDALATRIQASGSKVLVTVDGTTRRGKPVQMKEIADEAASLCPELKHMVVINNSGCKATMLPGRDYGWHELSDLGKNSIVETVETSPNDPLCIIYTSGTTGAPKGIVHSHLGFVLKAAIDFGYVFDVQSDDTIAWITDMGWMLGPLMIFGGLHMGATLVMIEGTPDYPDINRLWKVVERHQATFLGIAPTVARGLRAALNNEKPMANIGSLRCFASTGEAWDEPSWHWLFETVGDGKLPILNYSGGTEVGGGILVCYTISPCTAAAFSGPAPGMDVDVVTSEGEPTQDIGELVVRNIWPGMTNSFWKDDARYLETYWSQIPGLWVHGDLASVDEDGFWHIHGRSDDTLKIGGRRIGPAEIESALIAIDGVAEAAVIGVPDPVKGQVAIAFVVPRTGVNLVESVLEQAMIKAVGKGMLPARFHCVSALPKTKNGKIMRRAIRARYLSQPAGELSSLDPLTPLEIIPVMA